MKLKYFVYFKYFYAKDESAGYFLYWHHTSVKLFLCLDTEEWVHLQVSVKAEILPDQ